MITRATKSAPSINMATKLTAMNAVVEEEVSNQTFLNMEVPTAEFSTA